MSILQKISQKLRGNDCERLVKRTANEIKINGLGIEGGGVDINIMEFSNQIRELVRVPSISIDMDNMQYLLCSTISSLKNDNPLQNKCIAIRLQLILAFNQLSSILTSIKEEPSEDLKRQLSRWLRYSEDLHKHSISLLDPAGTELSKSSMPLDEIMRYQGIDKDEVLQAVNEYKSKE